MTAASLAAVPVLYAVVALLSIVVPGTAVAGYVSTVKREKPAAPLPYVLNGVRVLFIVLALYGALTVCGSPIGGGSWWYNEFHSCAVSACALGLFASLYFWVRARLTGANRHQPQCASSLSPSANPLVRAADEFYTGSELNPRWTIGTFPFDVKMYLYLIGAILLEIFVLSAAYKHYEVRGSVSVSWSVAFYTIAMSWFVIEYLYHEHVHLYTWDIFAENIGFKLVWGCMCFYPCVYAVGSWALVHDTQSIGLDTTAVPPLGIAVCGVMFAIGWILTRGPNMQKYHFKLAMAHDQPIESPLPFRWLFGLITIPIQTVGTRPRALLASGFWRLSRHINYFGELLQSVALTIPALAFVSPPPPGASIDWRWVALVYPLYYVGLFIGRERADAARCAAKYGDKMWSDYCRAVPYRIIPFLY